jgi:pyruvate/2-oxoglutarate dehydrogenase complex dihydrolipoamide acyltransferase (E2) component
VSEPVTEVLFPRLSEQNPDGEGVVATWFVDDGARVAMGQLVAEVAVDKIDAEVFAPADGVVRILVTEGQVGRPGQAIARVG